MARHGTGSLIRPPSPFSRTRPTARWCLLKDGSILLTISGTPKEGGPAQAAVFTSRDRGASWTFLSTIKADHDLDEANAVQLRDGRLVLMASPRGGYLVVCDQGRTWTAPATFGMRMFAPSLYVLKDGTLVCLHGSYAARARRPAIDLQHRRRHHLDRAGEDPRFSRGQLLRLRQGDGASRRHFTRRRPGHGRTYHRRREEHVAPSPARADPRRPFGYRLAPGAEPLSSSSPGSAENDPEPDASEGRGVRNCGPSGSR